MKKILTALSVTLFGILAFAGVASAQAPEDVEEMATSAAGDLVPIMLAVAAAMVIIAVTSFGIRYVFRFIRSGRGG